MTAGLFFKSVPAEETELICPKCDSSDCQRSRRRSASDYIYGVTKIRPWRCCECGHRFFAWKVPLRFLGYAHCRRCGRFELQRMAREHAEGSFRFVGQFLCLPLYRCPPCRNRFFSMLPRKKERAAEASAVAGNPSART